MPLFLDDSYSDLIKYKFLRGAKTDSNDFEQQKCYGEAYEVFIPDIYAIDVNEIIKI